MHAHAVRRAVERYGIAQLPYARIARAIQSQDPERATFLRRQSGARTLWAVAIDGHVLPVVYNNRQGAIATVLPPTWFERNGFEIVDDAGISHPEAEQPEADPGSVDAHGPDDPSSPNRGEGGDTSGRPDPPPSDDAE
mgnify:FL=1